MKWTSKPRHARVGQEPAWARIQTRKENISSVAIMSFLLAIAVVLYFGFITFGDALALPSSIEASSRTGLRPLSFNSSGLFQISVFEDLHFGEAENLQWGPQQDINTVKVINSILGYESQSLVVLNGDLITGENTFPENSSHYIDEIVAPLIRRNIPWSSTYGNHDSDLNCSREAILARERQLGPSLAYTRSDVKGANAGVSNYYLPVFPSSDPSGLRSAPAVILWFFDSRGGNYYQQLDDQGNRVGQPNWVDASVVSWFRRTAQLLNRTYGGPGARTIPSIAFVHIPTNASRALQTSGGGQDAATEPGINDDYVLAGQAQGWNADGTVTVPGSADAYGGQDGPFMQALVDAPGLLAVFSGHDHGDDWCWRWSGRLPGMSVVGDGLDLCFGRHTGYGGYGTWTRGSRQILLSERLLKDDVIETWVRLETGDISGSVVLNSTYGTDRYPPVQDGHTYCPTCIYS